MTVGLDLRREARHVVRASQGADEGERRLAALLAAGFDEDAAEKVFVAVALPPPAQIARRISDLEALGFRDPVKMITSLPAILGLAIENIRGKIADLEALGFRDPVKMITSLPAILGYAIENIRGKIADLEALGFRDPVKMITSSPAILGLAIENIRGKIADLEALGFAARDIIAADPIVVGFARARVARCARIVAALADTRASYFVRLLKKRAAVIDRVEAARPADWAAMREMMS